MSAEKGSAFLLKVGDGGAPPVFATVAGHADDPAVGQRRGGQRHQQGIGRLARIAVRRRACARSRWRASGIFTGSAAETRIKANALAGLIDDYELSFESGERMRGRFLLTRLDYAGDYNGERTYALASKAPARWCRYDAAGQSGARRGAADRRRRGALAAAELCGIGRGRGGIGAAVRAGRAGGGRAAEARRNGGLFFHCAADRPDGCTRERIGEAIAEQGLARATPALKAAADADLAGPCLATRRRGWRGSPGRCSAGGRTNSGARRRRSWRRCWRALAGDERRRASAATSRG